MRQIAERLAAQGYDVTVLTSSHAARADEAVINNVKVRSFAISGNLVKGLRGDVGTYQAAVIEGAYDALLIKAAQQWSFDALTSVLPQITARKLFIPCGFSALKDPKYRYYFSQMPSWLRQFDGLIFYADAYQDIAFARGHQLSNLHVISNGADEREFAGQSGTAIRQRLGIGPQHDLLISVGSQIAAKGHWEVLRAFAAASLTRPTTLVINGNNPVSGWLARAQRFLRHLLSGRLPLRWEAWRLGLLKPSAERQVMLLDLPREQLVDLYHEADLFVLASHVEYSPLVLFEAAASGTAIVSSTAGNSVEVIESLGGGVTVSPASSANAQVQVGDLAAQLAALLADPGNLKAMGSRNRASFVARGLSWDKIVEQYRRLLCGEELATKE
jgi:glycosyltransferase involved in cell wall biosynthesis